MFVIQVGANDGKRFDPLHKHLRKNDKGIFIEPIEYYFKKLVKTYRKYPHLIFENVAIHDFDGTVKMYTIDIKKIKEIKKKSKNMQLQEVLRGISSLYKDRNQLRSYKEYISEVWVKWMKFKNLIKKYNVEYLRGVSSLYNDKNMLRSYKEYISEVKVKCMKFKTLIKKYNIEYIDWLFIDTEGHDLILIADFPFEILKPKKIYFACPDNKPYLWSKDETEKASKLLKENNYLIKNLKFNKLAILK